MCVCVCGGGGGGGGGGGVGILLTQLNHHMEWCVIMVLFRALFSSKSTVAISVGAVGTR